MDFVKLSWYCNSFAILSVFVQLKYMSSNFQVMLQIHDKADLVQIEFQWQLQIFGLI